MNLSEYQLFLPEELALRLAGNILRLRLNQKWKQSTMAERSGVSLSTLRRFERTGLISLKYLLRLAERNNHKFKSVSLSVSASSRSFARPVKLLFLIRSLFDRTMRNLTFSSNNVDNISL